jgi:nitric oxide reductase large subunit
MKRLWMLFCMVLIVSLAVFGWIGSRTYPEAPPIDSKALTTGGSVVIDTGVGIVL